MKTNDVAEARRYDAGNVPEGRNGVDTVPTPVPRKLTFSENVILTIKIFAIAGLLGTVIWGIEVWTK